MPTSLHRRNVLSVSTAIKLVALIAAITVGMFMAAKDSAPVFAGTTTSVTLSSNASSAPADTTTILQVLSGQTNFSAVITTSPSTAFVAPSPGGPGFSGATHPALGDIAATISSDTNLGLNNGACNTNLNVPFTMLVATADNSGGNEIPAIPQADTGGLGTLENMATDTGNAPGADPPHDTNTYAPSNGLPASVDRYPAYLNDIFNNTQPLARYVGNTVVASTQVSLNFVVFSPGALKAAFPAPHPFNDLDASLGYTSVSVLQDPSVAAAPSSITDFCTPLTVNTTTLGTTEATACQGVPGCATLTNPASSGNDSGKQRYRNPPGSTHVWYNLVSGLRDQDGDGIEDAFDTCPDAANTDGDPRTTNGPDGDMLDSVCDPTPGTNTGSGNHDGDTAAGRAWNNGQDNCPIVVNGTNLNTDSLTATSDVTSTPRGGPKGDGEGDACDSNPSVSNGRYRIVLNETAQCIGGTDSDGDGWCATHGSDATLNDPNDGNAAITPEHYNRMQPLEIAHSGAGVNALVLEGEAGTAQAGIGLQPQGHAGNTQASGYSAGQPYQVCNDGLDNDLDTLVDLLDPGCLPTGLAAGDADGDGWNDEAELHVGTDALGRCEHGASAGNGPSSDWPGDLVSGSIPNSTDRLTIGDLSSFVAPPPRKLGTAPGAAGFDRRWDLQPGSPLGGQWINVLDLSTLVSGSTGSPPMYGGSRAFGSATLCTAFSPHPYGD